LLSLVVGTAYAAGVALQGWLGDQFGLRRVGVGFALLFFALLVTAHRSGRQPFARLEGAAVVPNLADAP
jgi:hypothetical protein